MTEIQQGLWITAVGMGLVFAVIIFLWGVMALLMRLTSHKPTAVEEEHPPVSTDEPLIPELASVETQRRAAAAAAAVALALAENKGHTKKAVEPTGSMNPWLAVHRSRQVEQKKRRG